MPEERASPEPIGLGLVGSWIELASDVPIADLEQFGPARRRDPAMGAESGRTESPYAPPMLIVERRTGSPAGLIENHGLPAGVATVVVYLDPHRGRPGYGLEALALYVSHLFDSGARLVVGEVLEFNSATLALMRRLHVEPQARMREHVYVAGRFWDVLVYSFDREQWLRGLAPFRRRLPGGSGRPAAIGGRRTTD